MKYDISYGKFSVPLYRVYAAPLTGVTPIPESPFTGRSNNVLAAEIDVEVFGDNFLPAYTAGDNSQVVATDSMKNYILRHALDFTGATLEELLHSLGTGLLARYEQMQALRVTGRELPFTAATVPDGAGGFMASAALFHRSHDDYGLASLRFERDEADSGVLTEHRCGRAGLQLLKITGSAFTHFVRDDYTTLPERVDRPLYVYMDVFWTYTDAVEMLDASHSHYAPSEQIRDFVATVFDGFVSESIQHLTHEIGTRLLARFPRLATVSFEAQNRTRDPVAISASDAKVKVYSDPFPAFGVIKLTIQRE
ncbi:MAG TPA: urate oxidase [Ktedonobacterales bacterium]|nr:urate oxidase [Ktedonobacterales bacterium]